MVSGDMNASGRDLDDMICRTPDLKKVLWRLARLSLLVDPRYVYGSSRFMTSFSDGRRDSMLLSKIKVYGSTGSRDDFLTESELGIAKSPLRGL